MERDELRRELERKLEAGERLSAQNIAELAAKYGVTEGVVRGTLGHLVKKAKGRSLSEKESEEQPTGLCPWCGRYELLSPDRETLVCLKCGSIFARIS